MATDLSSPRPGYDSRYYTDAVGAGSNDVRYYLSAVSKGGEPPGRWMGSATSRLGLTGQVDAQQMYALYHEDVAPDGQPLKVRGRKPQYRKMRDEAADRIDAAVQAWKEKHPLWTDRELQEVKMRELAKTRSAVPFYDMTLSASKSISLVHASHMAAAAAADDAGDADLAKSHRAEAAKIEDAMWTAAGRVVARLERNATYTRTGHHGGATANGAWRDGAGLVVAGFLQHSSREDDPQLHVHLVIYNKTLRGDGADDTWRTLHGHMLYHERLGAAAVADRVHTQQMTAQGRPMVVREDGNGFEIGGVAPSSIDAFSSRRTNITKGKWVTSPDGTRRWMPGLDEMVKEYQRAYGRPPGQRALWSMHQYVWSKTRRAKADTEADPKTLMRQWIATSASTESQALHAIHHDVGSFADDHPETVLPVMFGQGTREAVIRQAVYQVQTWHAAWTRSHLMFELHRAMPLLPADVDPEPLLEQLADEAVTGAVPDVQVIALAPVGDPVDVSSLGVRESDGQSVYRPPGEELFTTVSQLDLEEFLLTEAATAAGRLVERDRAVAAVAVAPLDHHQRDAALGWLTSTRFVQTLVAPAGTGKTRLTAEFTRMYTELTGRRVIGLATATNAARQMEAEAAEAGATLKAYNIAQFLGKVKDSDRLRWPVHVDPGDVLVIDEATQLSTADLARLFTFAKAHGARIFMIGDTEQLGSPEAAGMFQLIAKRLGFFQLREVRRFNNAWERDASLLLHDGDTRVIGRYVRHGRVKAGPEDVIQALAVRRYLADFLDGRDTLLMAGANDEAHELSRQVRVKLVDLGRVEPETVMRLSDGNEVSTGDQIRARLNTTIRAGGRPLTNRDTLRVVGWKADGAAIAQRKLRVDEQDRRAARRGAADIPADPAAKLGSDIAKGAGLASWAQRPVAARDPEAAWSKPFVVPKKYLAKNAELDYAGNVHVAQGRTIDTGHGLVSETLNRKSLYVQNTRGRDANHMYVVTGPPVRGANPVEQAPAAAVLASVMKREPDDLSATEQMAVAQDYAGGTRHLLQLWAAGTREQVYAEIDKGMKARLTAPQYARYTQEPQKPVLQKQLRAAQLAGVPLDRALDYATAGSLAGAGSVSAVMHSRLIRMPGTEKGTSTTWAQRTPGNAPDMTRRLAESLDARQRELGERLADRPEPWLLGHLGVPPREPGPLREDYVARAGLAGAYREAAGVEDPVQAVGPNPDGNPELEEMRASAQRALNMEPQQDPRLMERAQLEGRVAEYGRALGWRPPEVSAELQHAAEAEADARMEAGEARAAGRAEEARAADSSANLMAGHREKLQGVEQQYHGWHTKTADMRREAEKAQAELDRRAALNRERQTAQDERQAQADANVPRLEDGSIDLLAAWRKIEEATPHLERLFAEEAARRALDAERARQAESEAARTAEADAAAPDAPAGPEREPAGPPPAGLDERMREMLAAASDAAEREEADVNSGRAARGEYAHRTEAEARAEAEAETRAEAAWQPGSDSAMATAVPDGAAADAEAEL